MAAAGVSGADRDDLLSVRDELRDSPTLARLVAALRAGMGAVAPALAWPDLTDPHMYPWALLSVVPDTFAYHRRYGFPDTRVRASLADLGRQLDLGRRANGRFGLPPGAGSWLTLHYRGLLVQFDRLQFQRVRRPDSFPDRYVLDVHIPASGPLRPDLVDADFEAARSNYLDRYPESDYGYATCDSWLLDGQLAEYLPEGSNILAFARRFQPFPDIPPADPDDAKVLGHVFGRSPEAGDWDRLPQETTLQRAVITHLRAGRHWYFRPGWCALG